MLALRILIFAVKAVVLGGLVFAVTPIFSALWQKYIKRIFDVWEWYMTYEKWVYKKFGVEENGNKDISAIFKEVKEEK